MIFQCLPLYIAIEICGTERDGHKHATCTAIGPEAYECTCNKGYTGNGKICTGIDSINVIV